MGNVKLSEERVEEIILELERIRRDRKERGNIFLDAVLESSKSIKDKYVKWYERAIDELFMEIDLLNELVPYDELDEQKQKMEEIQIKYYENVEELNKFISSIESGDIKSFEELGVLQKEGSPKKGTFSSIPKALSIARDIEALEKKVETTSRFINNVIILAKRVYYSET